VSDTEPRDWPLRAAGLAVAGAAIGLAIHLLLRGKTQFQPTEDTLRIAVATFLGVGGIVYAFVVERERQALSLGFAVVAGLIVASVIHWNGGGPGAWFEEPWRLTCALLTVAIGAPLFQAWRGAGERRSIPYVAAHNHAWTNVVLWFAAWAFVGIVWGLAFLLSELFQLIGIEALRVLINMDWFGPTLTGAAFGGAVGVLRDREKILGTLQRVVTTVLSVLAPVLAVGLLVFLAALPFTGLAPLWQATKSTTPILLACVIGALILANAVIGDAPEDESRGTVLRWAAVGLGIAMLPLAVIAAVSTGARIDQYGLTPDRLWAVVFTIIACAYGLAYLVAVVRARGGWAAPVRVANLRLGLALCGGALLLSTPLLGFGAISTRDQLARLESGQTSPAKFDWAALRFDFGPEGKAAVERLAKAGTTLKVREAAAAALRGENKYTVTAASEQRQRADILHGRLRILPAKVALPSDLRTRLAAYDACGEEGDCTILYTPGANEVFVARSSPPQSCGQKRPCVAVTEPGVSAIAAELATGRVSAVRLVRDAKGWLDGDGASLSDPALAPSSEARKARAVEGKAEYDRKAAAVRSGSVEVREVRRRQVFVGGEPVGQPFE